jgi:hypothetical protein
MVNDVEILARSMPVEQDLGLGQVRQRHADLADLGPRHLVDRVEAALRGQVQRDRQAGLALVEQEAVALVRRLGGAEARVLADRPQPAAITVLEDAAGEGRLAGLADPRRIDRLGPDADRHLDAGRAGLREPRLGDVGQVHRFSFAGDRIVATAVQ